MKKEGLCKTCIHFTTCIFSKEPSVWLCEEFSSGNNVPTKFKQVKTKRVVYREIATESE